MQFNSWIFLGVFLPVTLIIYFLLSKMKNRQYASVALVVANLIFYGYANIKYLYYFIICIIINYCFAVLLIRTQKKIILIIGLASNIIALSLLKYCNFFIKTLNTVFKTDYNLIHMFIPLGLSFFTFQFVALLYDCYKKKITKLNFLSYLVFTTYFPKIIQGPITIFQDFEKQFSLETSVKFNWENFAKGLYMLTMGLGKKILIADVLGLFVTPGFSTNYMTYNSSMTVLLVLSYSLQIYFDFSGYSDMSRGLSFLFNIELPRNFDSPYKALSVNSFWKRWHMSLTGFFTKYLYIPLGGNRKGEFRTYLNTMIVFAVSGLWHGANYTFIIWGLLHGIASVLEKKFSFVSKLNVVVQWLYTFTFINITWIFFRSDSLTQAFQIIHNILNLNFTGIDFTQLSVMILPEVNQILLNLNKTVLFNMVPLLFIFLLLLVVLQARNSDEKIKNFKPGFAKVMFTILVMSLSILHFGNKITFIYEMF